MGVQLFANNASTALNGAISSGATSLAVTPGTGALFPNPTGGDFFMLTLTQGGGTETSWEILKCTARSTDTLTVVRAQEGTAAAGWSSGSRCELRMTAASMNTKQDVGGKDASGGYAGLTLFKLNLRNAANTITNFFTNATTAARTWTLPDKDGTVAMTSDITGTNSGTNTGDQTAGASNFGYLNIPQNSQSAAYTLVLADAGKHILHPSADTTARTFTIPANSSVAYGIGTAVTFVNQNAGGVITIAITTDTMRLAGAGTTGSRTLAANGIATAVKLTATEWLISGTGLT